MEAGYVVCEHVTEYKKKKDALCTYEILHACFVAYITKDAIKIKDQYGKCQEQTCGIRGRIHACLSCKYIGCHKFKHIHNHAAKENHAISMDINNGAVFCFKCKDFQYDSDFEKIAREQISSPLCPRDLSANKWLPSIEQVNLLREHNIIDIAEIELRGLTNLGNTCYINCILQSLIHAPVFRNYFLSMKHKCESASEPFVYNDSIIENPPSCFVCEVSDILQECFSGETESYSATRFLLLIWIRVSDFRGYEMHDALHFYLKLIENLHSSLQGTPSDKHFRESDIDIIFSGTSETVNTCNNCKNVSASLQAVNVLPFNAKPELKSGSNVVPFKDCLEKYLESVLDVYDCAVCGKSTAASETILKRLPLICCFQITFSQMNNISNKKNCDYKDKNGDTTKKENPDDDTTTATKKDIRVSFEEYFDMTPYKFSRKKRSEKSVNMESNPLNFFYLFAVVQYKGEGTSGHYISYVRRNRDRWFECDDDKISPISREQVKQKNPYLLFYQRPMDEYSKAVLSEAAH